ncbi:hypothetical protein BDZ89DRAFT_1053917, partial [Hymenopellis radicata]
ESDLGDVLQEAINAVDHNDGSLDFKIVGDKLRTEDFSLKGSALHGDKDMTLSTTGAFTGIVTNAISKNKKGPEITLMLTELMSARTKRQLEDNLREAVANTASNDVEDQDDQV